MALFSVVIPCRNEEKYIEKCIDSLVKNISDTIQLEIFVIDGMSNDNTREILKKKQTEIECLNIIDNPDKITPIALNIGIKKSKGDFIAILGAHAEVESSYFIKALQELSRDQDISCIGGLIKNIYEDNRSCAIGMAMSSPFGVGNAYFRTGKKSGFVDTVAFGIYRKNVFEKVGYFDETLARNQDDEFNFRLTQNGLKIYLCIEIKSEYYVRASWTKLFRQYFQYGYWKVFVNKKHSSITSLRQLIPFIFVSSIIVLAPLSFAHWAFLLLLMLELCLWLTGALLFASKITKKTDLLFKTLAAFGILHISYGIGYCKGIINFIILQKKPHQKDARLSR